MTFTEIYSEITQRIGQGYGNYSDRAKSAFWKAVGALIRAGNYAQDDIRGLAKRSEAEATLASEFPWSIATETGITNDHAFDMQIQLTPGQPDNIHYTRLDEHVAHRGSYMAPLHAGGVRNVYYTLRYPIIELTYNTGDSVLASAWCKVLVTWYGILREFVEETTQDTAQAGGYMSQGFIDQAIEAALKILVTET